MQPDRRGTDPLSVTRDAVINFSNRVVYMCAHIISMTTSSGDCEKPIQGDTDHKDIEADYVEADEDEIATLGRALIDAILEYAPMEDVQGLLDKDAPLWYQDEDGWSALHAAASVEDADLVRKLLQRGALWNSADNAGNTAGDIALSLNDGESYLAIRDAGIRSEIILQLLASRDAEPHGLVLKEEDDTALGSTDNFLSSHLRYTIDAHGQDICLLQVGDAEIGVMMGWESGIMQETVRKMCEDHPSAEAGLRVLNVGFGLGIIDSYFQALPVPPSTHVIIEPHPDVLKYMREQGWYDKKGVVILEGKWQDIVGTQKLEDMVFDVVYTDTFSEEYEDLRLFFGHVPNLLAGPDARFSFFNGLGAINALFYDVYTHLAELHLAELGIDVDWEDVDVAVQEVAKWNNTREYFTMRLYRLPVGRIRNTM
ncbi:S-adenosyl-L-methionine-dependent methyltransferase [Multifurca ochricompacta]|uniref:S-adenosyl-L-methionine-dependent methyltransferase n=1 Tax=Multifurca ochricompacta TaxID=376703 RepID=A0AAD4M3M7_9AGAM|nr:S-adenosyl-L-methionine-dependent methyltransferase [Multifurca ochricompacta]